jgi:uncharacterized protein YgiM (DUF1202 family)
MTNIKPLFILLPLLLLACTLTAQATPLPQDGRGAVIAQTIKPTEQPQTASPSPAPLVCSVKTGIEAGALNLRACGGIDCPVLIVLHDGETLTQTKQEPVNGWMEVRTSNGLRGWLNSKYTDCEVTK